VRRELVAVTVDGQDRWVVLSPEEYARLKRRDRKVYKVGNLPDEWLDAVERGDGPAPRPTDAELTTGRP
jgi:hypothetical protein